MEPPREQRIRMFRMYSPKVRPRVYGLVLYGPRVCQRVAVQQVVWAADGVMAAEGEPSRLALKWAARGGGQAAGTNGAFRLLRYST